MQYSTLLLTILAASGAMAAPQGSASNTDSQIRVILSNQAMETGSQTAFREVQVAVGKPTQSGPFTTVELKLGAAIRNKALRCQVLDENNKPIVVKRGANTDITFADGGKGEWTFRSAAKVSSIVCNQAFKKLEGGNEVRVVLSNQATETGIQTAFTDGSRQEKTLSGSDRAFQTVELRLGPLVDPAYRCQIVDSKTNAPITVTRGANVDITFGDGGKGEWKLPTMPSLPEVGKIICDPKFVKKA